LTCEGKLINREERTDRRGNWYRITLNLIYLLLLSISVRWKDVHLGHRKSYRSTTSYVFHWIKFCIVSPSISHSKILYSVRWCTRKDAGGGIWSACKGEEYTAHIDESCSMPLSGKSNASREPPCWQRHLESVPQDVTQLLIKRPAMASKIICGSLLYCRLVQVTFAQKSCIASWSGEN
jgi:hypothetical protein